MSKILIDAVSHYERLGYQLIDVPYLVDVDVSNLTKPWFVDNLHHDNKKVYVGSGEQSFIQLMKERKINKGKYMCITPCYRDEKDLDKLHLRMFMKLELINISDELNKPCFIQQQGKRIVYEVLNDAKEFFDQYSDNIRIIQTGTHRVNDWMGSNIFGSCMEHDILNNDIEIGSYGIRETLYGRFVYGTGLALPRFNQTFGDNIEF